jgi:hypothetical protein
MRNPYKMKCEVVVSDATSFDENATAYALLEINIVSDS